MCNAHIIHIAIVKYRSNIGGMSDGVPRMISVLLKFIFVSVQVLNNNCNLEKIITATWKKENGIAAK